MTSIAHLVDAVLFDLDDTLFEQRQWLSGAWDTVADAAARLGVDRVRFRGALSQAAEAGSDKGRIIDRALEIADAADCPVPPLVEAFKAHRSCPLEPYQGVRGALRRLRRVVPVGLVTDGDPWLQRDKLSCLHLADEFDVKVFSDEHGREARKPHPAGLLLAVSELGTVPSRAVFVGDRPSKDVAGAHAAGMRAIRVLTGEYRSRPDDPPAWTTVQDAVAAIEAIEPLLGGSRCSST